MEQRYSVRESDIISILSFNILADCYCPPEFFPYADKQILLHSYRAPLIVKQIGELDADIVCLQEVDHYEDYFQGRLKALGYRSIYEPKSSRREGLLVAWKESRFKMTESFVRCFDRGHEYDQYFEFQKGYKALFVRLRDVNCRILSLILLEN
eukprot:TRINITY_DN4846_c0_g3_i2.p1 TRINITY_DN4846_c0_g3~~TRINITY_DN4846_c0_g3_i2.p1  ORF type:complete len:153 (-),score=11.94 TRINITY_DN4846_c0_g3_i2:158-616(-)